MANQAIDTVNRLIETCKDGEQGFRTAAESAESPAIKQMLASCARERAQFAAELQAEIRRLGGAPETAGSVSGSLHRGWMSLKSAVGMGDRAIVDEAERGEDSAKQTYEEALRESLPADIRSIVERQYARITAAHERVRSLRDSSGRAA